jgi:hypothetical protein
MVAELREWLPVCLDGLQMFGERVLFFGDELPMLREGLPVQGEWSLEFAEALLMSRERFSV